MIRFYNIYGHTALKSFFIIPPPPSERAMCIRAWGIYLFYISERKIRIITLRLHFYRNYIYSFSVYRINLGKTIISL